MPQWILHSSCCFNILFLHLGNLEGLPIVVKTTTHSHLCPSHLKSSHTTCNNVHNNIKKEKDMKVIFSTMVFWNYFLISQMHFQLDSSPLNDVYCRMFLEWYVWHFHFASKGSSTMVKKDSPYPKWCRDSCHFEIHFQDWKGLHKWP